MSIEKSKRLDAPMNLLVVEDDDVDVISLRRSFSAQGVDVQITRAVDGVDALERLRSGEMKEPFLVLLDIQMPRMTGIEFLTEVRADPVLDSSVVFVLTTSQAQQDVLASFKKNVAGYFVKNESAKDYQEVVDLMQNYWQTSLLPRFLSASRQHK